MYFPAYKCGLSAGCGRRWRSHQRWMVDSISTRVHLTTVWWTRRYLYMWTRDVPNIKTQVLIIIPVRLLIPKTEGADLINMLDVMGSKQITTPPPPQHRTQRSERALQQLMNLRAPVGFACCGRRCCQCHRLVNNRTKRKKYTPQQFESRRQSRRRTPQATALNHALCHRT